MTSDRRSFDESGREVEDSMAGASGPDDLDEWEAAIGRLFVEWAVQHRLFTMFAHDDLVPAALASAFKAGWEAAESRLTA